MKIVFDIPILDRVVRKIREARQDHATIECVVLLPSEYSQLRRDPRSDSYYISGESLGGPGAGSLVRIREFRRQAGDNHRGFPDSFRSMQYGTIMNVPVFIVPEEFHP